MTRSLRTLIFGMVLGACSSDGGKDEHKAKIAAQQAEREAELARPGELRSRLAKVHGAEATADSTCAPATAKRVLFVERELLAFLVTGKPEIDLKTAGTVPSIDDWRSLSSSPASKLRDFDWLTAREANADREGLTESAGRYATDRGAVARELIEAIDRGLGDLVVVVEAATKERPRTSNVTFESGRLAGRATAIDPATGKPVCTIEFQAKNSRTVTAVRSSEGGENGPIEDLTGNARKAILDAFGKRGVEMALVL